MKTLTRDELLIEATKVAQAYRKQGYSLTLRQLYYQLVAAGTIPNADASYKRLGDVLGDARLIGEFDMDLIEDRGRDAGGSKQLDCKLDVEDALKDAEGYLRAIPNWTIEVDRWFGQPKYVSAWCFPDHTAIMVEDGCVPISTIEAGDKVLTREGSYRKVTEVMQREHDGDLVVLKVMGLPDIEATPEHPILVLPWDSSKPSYSGRRRKTLPVQYKTFAEVARNDMVMVPRVKTVDTEVATGFRSLGGVKGRRGFAPTKVELLLNLGTYAALGLYLAEGSIREDGRTVQFCFGKHEEATFAQCIQDWSARLGLTATSRDGAGTRIVHVFGKALASWLSQEFGNGSWNKKLPAWVMTAPLNLQEELLKHHFFGDGSNPDASHPGIVFNTRSGTLAKQEHLLLIRLGYAATLCSVTDHGEPMWRVGVSGADGARLSKRWGVPFPDRANKKSFNHAWMDDDYAYYPVRSTSTRPFSGTVYNLEVESSHTYCLPVVVHNCEKDALSGVFQKPCESLGVGFFACKGYPSHSALWQWLKKLQDAYQRSFDLVIDDEGNEYQPEEIQEAVILYFGDHDPDGWQIPRSAEETVNIFAKVHGLEVPPIRLVRMALNRDQIKKYNPPPFPAKPSSSRFKGYVKEHGLKQAWELDALKPDVLDKMIRTSVKGCWDEAIHQEWQDRARACRDRLRKKMAEPDWLTKTLGD